ncbi:hypothetical protein G5C51_33880 [Streptomyces sp. A7024]|uniref:Uncharacterized protein n=1 Tax=Streptomyces coryli TaxID=1128680 RepID=A0A6G4UAX8_9ACTN|nr:hypothetical protein [Streptomyces coryli]NGN68870.1 hypothetical protein [Streptomyces coryli]
MWHFRHSVLPAAAVLLAVGSLGAAAPADGSDVAPASAEVRPAVAAPGSTVTITVTCPFYQGVPDTPTVKVTSQAFATGEAVLKADPEGALPGGSAYKGTAQLPPRANFSDDGPNGPVGRVSEWGVDGTCGDGTPIHGVLKVDRDKTR